MDWNVNSCKDALMKFKSDVGLKPCLVIIRCGEEGKIGM